MTPARMAAIMYARLQVAEGVYQFDDCDADPGPSDCDAIKPS